MSRKAELEEAQELLSTKPAEAEQLLLSLVADEANTREQDNKIREQAIYALGNLYVEQGNSDGMKALFAAIRPVVKFLAKHKTAKVVKDLLKLVARLPNSDVLELELCLSSIEWANEQNRTFLRQSLETKLANLYFRSLQYQDALKLLTKLIREVRRLDDKQHLVEIQLLESRVQHALRNVPKARGSLTAARSAANAIYCPPRLQAEIDMQAGTLHAEENDYKTAYSYFFEAFEGYNSLGEAEDIPNALLALKYMLLCKIMTNNTADIKTIMSGKMALKYTGAPIEAMRAIAAAYKNRSLQEFQQAKEAYADEITKDIIVNNHLGQLYDSLLEQNLLRIIEPYSCVEIAHVASRIQLPLPTVERKLSQMILDKAFQGVLDQGAGCLHVFLPAQTDGTYAAALETIGNMGKVVGSLFDKTKKLA